MYSVLSKEMKDKLRKTLDNQDFPTPIEMCMGAEHKVVVAHNEQVFRDGFAYGVFALTEKMIEDKKSNVSQVKTKEETSEF